MDFRAWLKSSPGFAAMTAADEPSRIVVCADDPAFPGRTHGTSGQAIRQAVYDLWTAGRDSTGELFVYYSGHGFLFKENTGSRAADVIVPGDFRTLGVDGSLCFRLDALQLELLSSMGPGNHYYFVDACRNQMTDDQIAVGSPVRLARSSQRAAQVFTLFSTSRLSTAPTASPFTELLVAGLAGRGKAKRPAGGTPARMRVVWSSLVEYMKTQAPAGRRTAATGRARRCCGRARSRLQDLHHRRRQRLAERSVHGQAVRRPGPAAGNVPVPRRLVTWQQPPDDYRLEITPPTGTVRAVDPAPPNPIDLYEDVAARFVLEVGAAEIRRPARELARLVGCGRRAREEPAPTAITVVAPDRARGFG